MTQEETAISFEAQIFVEHDPVCRVVKRTWRSVSPTHAEAYRYKTERAAWRMLSNYYPQVLQEHKRVVRVDYPPNMDEE